MLSAYAMICQAKNAANSMKNISVKPENLQANGHLYPETDIVSAIYLDTQCGMTTSESLDALSGFIRE